jgi:hypothetical protein
MFSEARPAALVASIALTLGRLFSGAPPAVSRQGPSNIVAFLDSAARVTTDIALVTPR